MSTPEITRALAHVAALVILSALSFGGCALSQQRGGGVRSPAAETSQVAAEPSATEAPDQREDDTAATGETNGQSQLAPPSEASPWSIVTTTRNGFSSNADFNEASIDSYGTVLATALQFQSDAVEFTYEIAGHSYTNTNRWDRVSHSLAASYERDLIGNLDLELGGGLAFKGSSEDRDVVDQDVEFSPQLEYRFTSGRRLVLFTKHRFKRYEDAPETNAFKNYVGLEFLETMGPRHYVELGGRFETNDEQRDRSDSRRWTYYVTHGIPLTGRDMLALQVRYRLKRYSHRFVEVEDEDVLRVDHRWSPSISWIRAVSPKVDLRFDYTYETNYSNDPEKEYRAHMTWMGLDFRWR